VSDGFSECPACGRDYLARDYCAPPNGEPFLNFTQSPKAITE